MLSRSKTAAVAAVFAAGVPFAAQAGGFVCELNRECVNNACSEVDFSPYIDTDWGKIVVTNYGPEMEMDLIPDNNGKFTLYANLPNGGLSIIVVNEDTSAVFTTFGTRGGSARVISIFGTCEPRG